MANRSHVPKFGDWSNQNEPFTVVFDNARTNKRQDLYESLEKPNTRPQAQDPPPPQPARKNLRSEPPKPVKEDVPRAPPPTDRNNRFRAPPADKLYGGGGGLYGEYGGGGGSGNHRQSPAPCPVQPKQHNRGGSGRRGATIPPFPGSVGSGEDMSYTHIFDQVKEERNRDGSRPFGGTASNTPSRPINGHQSSAPSSVKICCFSWSRKGSR